MRRDACAVFAVVACVGVAVVLRAGPHEPHDAPPPAEDVSEPVETSSPPASAAPPARSQIEELPARRPIVARTAELVGATADELEHVRRLLRHGPPSGTSLPPCTPGSFAHSIGAQGETWLRLRFLELAPHDPEAFHHLDRAVRDLLLDGRLFECRRTLDRFGTSVATKPAHARAIRELEHIVKRALGFAVAIGSDPSAESHAARRSWSKQAVR